MNLDKKIVDEIIEYVKNIYSKLELTHDINHIERVANLAIFLAEREGANVDIVKASAWLHDIGYSGLTKKEMVEKDHANLSIKTAQGILINRGLDKDIVESICKCILLHDSSRIKIDSSIEAKCLHDADKLDCVGVRGMLRLFAWNLTIEPMNCSISEYMKHLKKGVLTKEKVLITKTAKELANKWNKKLLEFFDAYQDEINF